MHPLALVTHCKSGDIALQGWARAEALGASRSPSGEAFFRSGFFAKSSVVCATGNRSSPARQCFVQPPTAPTLQPADQGVRFFEANISRVASSGSSRVAKLTMVEGGVYEGFL
jgi:hypothetical protein